MSQKPTSETQIGLEPTPINAPLDLCHSYAVLAEHYSKMLRERLLPTPNRQFLDQHFKIIYESIIYKMNTDHEIINRAREIIVERNKRALTHRAYFQEARMRAQTYDKFVIQTLTRADDQRRDLTVDELKQKMVYDSVFTSVCEDYRRRGGPFIEILTEHQISF
jgi:hypothetical protein